MAARGLGVGLGRREPCAKCSMPVFLAERLHVGSKLYHRTCFRCARCNNQLSLANCYETETDGVYCCETCPDEETKKPGEETDTREFITSLSDEQKSRSLKKYDPEHDEYSSFFETALEEEETALTKARKAFVSSHMLNEDSDDDVVTEESVTSARSKLSEEKIFRGLLKNVDSASKFDPSRKSIDSPSKNRDGFLERTGSPLSTRNSQAGSPLTVRRLESPLNSARSSLKKTSPIREVDKSESSDSSPFEMFKNNLRKTPSKTVAKEEPESPTNLFVSSLRKTSPVKELKQDDRKRSSTSPLEDLLKKARSKSKIDSSPEPTEDDFEVILRPKNIKVEDNLPPLPKSKPPDLDPAGLVTKDDVNSVLLKSDNVNKVSLSGEVDQQDTASETVDDDNVTKDRKSLVKSRMLLFEVPSKPEESEPESNTEVPLRISKYFVSDKNSSAVYDTKTPTKSEPDPVGYITPKRVDELKDSAAVYDSKTPRKPELDSVDYKTPKRRDDNRTPTKLELDKERISKYFGRPRSSEKLSSNESLKKGSLSQEKLAKYFGIKTPTSSTEKLSTSRDSLKKDTKISRDIEAVSKYFGPKAVTFEKTASYADLREASGSKSPLPVNTRSKSFSDLKQAQNPEKEPSETSSDVFSTPADKSREPTLNSNGNLSEDAFNNVSINDSSIYGENANKTLVVNESKVETTLSEDNLPSIESNLVTSTAKENTTKETGKVVPETSDLTLTSDLEVSSTTESLKIPALPQFDSKDLIPQESDLETNFNFGETSIQEQAISKESSKHQKEVSKSTDNLTDTKFESKLVDGLSQSTQSLDEHKEEAKSGSALPELRSKTRSMVDLKDTGRRFGGSMVAKYKTLAQPLSGKDLIEYPEELNPFGDEEEDHPSNSLKVIKPSMEDLTIISPASKKLNESLNPFDEDEVVKDKPPRPPLPAARGEATKKLLEAPKINLNPFWSDGDDPSDEEPSKPVPLPRTRPSGTPEPRPRRTGNNSEKYDSNSSLSSMNSSTMSSGRPVTPARKKKPAPPPPTTSLSPTSLELDRQPSPSQSLQTSPKVTPHVRRKNRKAPLPPTSTPFVETRGAILSLSPIDADDKNHVTAVDFDISTGETQFISCNLSTSVFSSDVEKDVEKEKIDKDEKNRNRQSQTIASPTEEEDSLTPVTSPDKSTYGKWKRRKGPAPSRPVPQRRQIKPLPLQQLKNELELIELQQQGLEKQGVKLEQLIREKCEAPGMTDDAALSPEVEELVLELFELVNEKNELFRRQAELMYLRRQQRLEEEYADLEYQIRCLMDQPERNKTDSDKAREEELINRLVEVVERRNEIVECLEMDRVREAEEDYSISTRLNLIASKREEESLSSMSESPVKLSKKEKKKIKKEKKLKEKGKNDADKDIDESETSSNVSKEKKKRKWF